MTRGLQNVTTVVANGRIGILGVPAHLGGVLALLTFWSNAAWDGRLCDLERLSFCQDLPLAFSQTNVSAFVDIIVTILADEILAKARLS